MFTNSRDDIISNQEMHISKLSLKSVLGKNARVLFTNSFIVGIKNKARM
jgi:hypothetical protein